MTSHPMPESARAVLIGASRFTDPNLPGLPAVDRTVTDLAAVLTDPKIGVVPARHCAMLTNPGSPQTVMAELQRVARDAPDLLLVYYGGHGVRDHHHDERLYLAVGDSIDGYPQGNAVLFDWVNDVFKDSASPTRVLFLDCCYAGRALGAMAGAEFDQPEVITIDGTIVITSTDRNSFAYAPDDEQYTVFGGALIAALREGLPNDEPLTARLLFREVKSRMASQRHPQLPRLISTDTSQDVVLRRPGTASKIARPLLPPPPAAPITVQRVQKSRDRRPLPTAPTHVLPVRRGRSFTVASASCDQDMLALGGTDGSVRLQCLPAGRPIAYRGHRGAVNAVAVAHLESGHAVVVTGGDDGVVRLLHSDTTPVPFRQLGHNAPVTAVTTARLGTDLVAVTASIDGSIHLWDLTELDHVAVLAKEKETLGVTAIAATVVEDLPAVVTGHTDGMVRLWDLATNSMITSRQMHTGWVTSVTAYSLAPWNPVVVSAGASGGLRAWMIGDNDKHIVPPSGVTLHSTTCLGTQDHVLLLAASRTTDSVQVWDLRTREPAGQLPSPGKPLVAVTATALADRDLALTTSIDGTTHMWDLTTLS